MPRVYAPEGSYVKGDAKRERQGRGSVEPEIRCREPRRRWTPRIAKHLEARVGIEPAYADLQSAA